MKPDERFQFGDTHPADDRLSIEQLQELAVFQNEINAERILFRERFAVVGNC